jgi:hypothetical protein
MPSGTFPNLQHWPLPYTSLDGRRRGRWLMYSDTRRSTTFIDLDVWPPNPVVIDREYVTSFDVLPDGRLVVCSMLTRPESDYKVRIHPPGWPSGKRTGPPDIIPTPITGEFCELLAIGDRILAFDALIEKGEQPEKKRAYVLKSGRFRPVPELPEVRRFRPGQLAHQLHANGKVTLLDGTEILIWDGNGYELKRGRFERTWKLGARQSGGLGGWIAVPWGQDGFFYLSDRRVRYARRGSQPVAVMKDADNVMYLSEGPEHSVIASHGKTRKALPSQVWFPADGSYIPVTRKDLGIAPNFHPHELYWSAATRHIYTKFGGLVTFPESDLLALKHVRPRAGGYKVSVPPT